MTRATMSLLRVMLVTLLLFGAPLAAETQPSSRLGMLLTGLPTDPTPTLDAFLRRLTELGWVEGRTLVIERRWTEDPGRFSALAHELVAQKVNVIVAPGGQATSAAKAATTSIPIVMIAFTDPVGAGLVSSLARPGSNLTGVTVAQPELFTGKRLEILTQAIPGLQRVAVLWDASVSLPRPEATAAMDTAAQRLGLRLHHAAVRGTAELEDAFRTAHGAGAGAVLVLESPLFTARADLVAKHGVTYRLPVMTLFPRMVERGALISYGPDLTDLFMRAAAQVDKILRGTSPASLPIEQPTTFALAINLKTAKALGVTIPPSLLLRADRIIE